MAKENVNYKKERLKSTIVADNQSLLIFLMNFFDGDYTQDRFQMSKYSSLDVKDKICTSQFSKI